MVVYAYTQTIQSCPPLQICLQLLDLFFSGTLTKGWSSKELGHWVFLQRFSHTTMHGMFSQAQGQNVQQSPGSFLNQHARNSTTYDCIVENSNPCYRSAINEIPTFDLISKVGKQRQSNVPIDVSTATTGVDPAFCGYELQPSSF